MLLGRAPELLRQRQVGTYLRLSAGLLVVACGLVLFSARERRSETRRANILTPYVCVCVSRRFCGAVARGTERALPQHTILAVRNQGRLAR